MTASPLKHSFGPVVNDEVRLLVLGSLPGEESLARAQYYAHPRNQFWRLMEQVTGTALVPLGYEERLHALLTARVGLWDVVASATRTGSLDGVIRDHRPNELKALVESLPNLRAIGFNGGTSARIGQKALHGVSGIDFVPLPSSSPALTLAFEEKRVRWLTLRHYL
ncbi:MAG TPA: DNA-deoxyinosine glycosylase [Allosphingosinicella sp.]|uniref:DNA-deoxyinosine glycosylase n=1 Tax=Allosphingosinicella sp. TaxID=2823234 RepID=UPI002EDA261F